MKKSTKILLIVSVAAILAGAAMMAGAWFAMESGASEEMAGLEFVENRHAVTDPFTKIRISTVNSSIEILPSADGVCRIVCDDSEKLFHTFSVTKSASGAQLNIDQHDVLQWFDILGSLYEKEEIKLTVYLPEAEYGLVHADSASGDITIAPDFRFQTVNLHTNSGNTKLTDLQADHLTISTSSGDLDLHSVEAKEDVFAKNISGFTRLEYVTAVNITTSTTSGNTALECLDADHLRSQAVSGQMIIYDSSFRGTSYLETSSGSIEISDSECGEQTVQSVSGSVTLQNVRGTSLNAGNSSGQVFLWDVLESGNILCNTGSGAILFSGLDAEALEFITSSGEISGNLLSAKNFIAETSSGYVSVPPSDESAGTCHISTVSGNINIVIEP